VTIFIECTNIEHYQQYFLDNSLVSPSVFSPPTLLMIILVFIIMHFVRYRFYKAGKQLAAIDWNYHHDTSAAVGSEAGEGRYSRKYNQRTKEWNTRIIKVDKDFAYIPILMAKIFSRRIEKMSCA